jgi:hypothetical protein
LPHVLICLLLMPFFSWSKNSSIFLGTSYVQPDSEVLHMSASEPLSLSLQEVKASIQPFAGFKWNVSGKHFLIFQWQQFQYSQNSERIKDIINNPQPFEVDFNLNIFQASYAFDISRSHGTYFQMLFGIHSIYYQYGFSSKPHYCNPVTLECRTFDTAPYSNFIVRHLPHVGFNYHYQLAKDWDVYWKLIYYDFKVSGDDDMLLDTDVSLSYRLLNSLYFRLGYRWSRVRIERHGENNLDNLITHQFFGPSAVLYYYFSL